MNKIKLFTMLNTAIILLIAMLSITVAASVRVDNGNIVGLDARKEYKYANVTLTGYSEGDYIQPEYTALPIGTSKIESPDAGLWYVYNITDSKLDAVWVAGDENDRNDIGEVYYHEKWKKDVVRIQSTEEFVAGVWTGKGASSNTAFPLYFVSEIGGSHITASDAQAYVNGSMTKRALRNKMQDIKFRYAYASDEIIPVNDLLTVSFIVGLRQGSISCYYDEDAPSIDICSKYVLYTMDETGKVSQHTALIPMVHTSTNSRTSHTIPISEYFPDAKGWVMGLDIYPAGSIPYTGLNFNCTWSNSHNSYLNTIYFIQYIPDGYTTKGKAGAMELPFYYNGVNKAYIKGYSNGMFHPDDFITTAEAVTMLTNIISDGKTIPKAYDVRFSDCSINDWYYEAVDYLDEIGGLKHIVGTRLYPNKYMTRGEFVSLLYSVARPKGTSANKFTDISEDDTNFEAINAFASNEIINGYPDNTFRPNNSITRAEAVTVINRIINLVVNEKTVIKDSLENIFKDTDGHWAEYDILMASNDNVKSAHHLEATTSQLIDNGSEIEIETKHLKISIAKKSGRVVSAINKYTGENIVTSSVSPWFSYLTLTSGIDFLPKSVELVDQRLKITYGNNVCAYFIVEVFDDYFTIELDSELPLGVKSLRFGILSLKYDFSDEDIDSYRLSGVVMNVNTNSKFFPGGVNKATDAIVYNQFNGMGAKLAIAFSKFGGKVYGEHRRILKDIVNAMDPEIAPVANHGGPFTYDKGNEDIFGDYVILSGGFTAATADETAKVMKQYSIDQLDIHQGGSTFIQGEFNFVCAKENGETFTTAKQFKERVGDIAVSQGIQLGLHTYSSLVPSNATTILVQPKWQQQIAYDEENVLTLKNDVNAKENVFLVNEDTSNLVLAESGVPWSGPYTRYYLIDEEIFLANAIDETGLSSITRARCGTTASAHKAGSEIRQLQCWYGMFQPIPGSELFYHIADNIAKAYNDGGFEMIYLDGLESFAPFVTSEESWYYYATFIHRVVLGCNNSPIIEGSAFPLGFWTSRGRGGAWDHSHRKYKGFNNNHLKSNKNLLNYFCTATMGWFHYSPDMGATHKNMAVKTVFRDDLDHMGSIGIAYDMTTVCQPFSVANFKTYKTLADNTMYYSLYSRLRKGGYFSQETKKALRDGISAGKEYRLEEQIDGSWAFREMTYVKNKVYDTVNDLYTTGNATNPYSVHTPYVRVEQRYTYNTDDELLLIDFDETKQVTAGTYEFEVINEKTRVGFKINVYGNNSETDAIMLSVNNECNFCIPLNFEGWREFYLMDADNADHEGYTFSGENAFYRGTFDYDVNTVKIILCGSCTDVKLDKFTSYVPSNAPALNPSVTVGDTNITFLTTLRSGEYVEYFPELNKAYHHYYDVKADGTNGNKKYVAEIPFEGKLSVPEGDFSYTYGGESTTGAILRAQVVIGLQSDDIIANEDTWTPPVIELDEDIQYVTIK